MNQRRATKRLELAASLLLAVCIGACGGSSGIDVPQDGGRDTTSTTPETPATPETRTTPEVPATSTAPSAPSLNLTMQSIKTFRFAWTDSAGELEYRLLEDPDGASGYTVIATLGANTISHDLQASLAKRINARYILRACNAAGCTDSASVAVSGNLAQAVGYVKASNTGASDRFGGSVAVSADGNTLAVGAYSESSSATGIDGNQADDSAALSGAVYVFVRNNVTWIQQAYVKASDTAAGDRFGTSVALSADGNTLAVGAIGEGSSATGIDGNQADISAANSGAVYVYSRNGAAWSQQAYVKASNTNGGDAFGYRVSLSADGNALAVSAPGEDSNATGINGDQSGNTAVDSGAVYLFARSGTVWSQDAYVKASNAMQSDRFGISALISGDGATLVVGASSEGNNATGVNGNQNNRSGPYTFSGAAYVFVRSGGVWTQQAYLKASNTQGFDQFGASVSLSFDGNTLAVGASHENSNATGVDGDQNDDSLAYSGAVYIFTRNMDTWSQQAYVKASNTGADDLFGGAVSLSADGSTLAVGAYREDSNATGINGNQADNSSRDGGAMYLFNRNGAVWRQKAYLKAPNTGEFDGFGSSVSLSGNGNTLAIGAVGESSDANGINGNQADDSANASGAIYLY